MPAPIDWSKVFRARGLPLGYDRFTRTPIDVTTLLRAAGAERAVPPQTPLSDIEIIASHLYPSPLDWWFNVAAPITLAANAVRSVVVNYDMKPGMLGILRNFSTGVANLADWDAITWAIEISGSPIIGFDNITGPISDLLNPLPLFWPLFTGQGVRVVATNLSASAINNVTAMVRGTTFAGTVHYG